MPRRPAPSTPDPAPRQVTSAAPATPLPATAPPADTAPATPLPATAPRADAAPATPPTPGAIATEVGPAVPAQEIEQRPATAESDPRHAALLLVLTASPGYAPELLAIHAVTRLAPPVQAHVTWLRATYPGATPDALARLATGHRVRQARIWGAAAGLAGPLGVLADSAALVWTQARLVLELAAAYGRDPTDPERAAEILTLQGVHADLDAARAAVAAARRSAENRTENRTDNGTDKRTDNRTDNRTENGADDRAAARTSDGPAVARLAVPLARVAGRALAQMAIARRASRLVPGAGAVVMAVAAARSTERLAARATRLYRQ